MSSARSRFTPSLMSHDLLERLFVAREQTLDRILARAEAALTSAERNHTLLVGPRGAGKTHLVSLVYYRVRHLMQVAWLPEDPWTIVSYRHLLREIVEQLEPHLDLPLPSSEADLEAQLLERSRTGGPIVVIVENFDQILDAIDNYGQQKLRHLLQAHRPFLLVATTTRLDRTLSDQAEPFYGFFTTTRLEPFGVEEAAAMLSAIATDNGDDKLVEYLATDEGRRRLQTIAHLAGGQPRIWALLASALDRERLDDLVDLLLTQFDDLTPYYQEQLARLSGQQRLIVAELADADRPINVGDLAMRLGIDQRSLSKTLGELVERGWLLVTRSPLAALLDRRRSYYELAEPLVRISFQLKAARGEPLKLVVEFLKHWFDPSDLAFPIETADGRYLTLAIAGQDTDPVVAVTRKLSRIPATGAPSVDLLGEIDDALAALHDGDPAPMLGLPTPIRLALEDGLATRGLAELRRHVHDAARDEFNYAPHDAMGVWIARAERWVASTTSDDPSAQVVLVQWLIVARRFDEAEQALIALTQQLGTDDLIVLFARVMLASSYIAAGNAIDAVAHLAASHEGLQLALGAAHPVVVSLNLSLASAYETLGRSEHAANLYESTLVDALRVLGEDHIVTVSARNNLARLYLAGGQVDEAVPILERTLAGYERVLGLTHPQTLKARKTLVNARDAAAPSPPKDPGTGQVSR